MENKNLQGFLINVAVLLLGYGTNKLTDAVNKTNTAAWTPVRTSIYQAAEQALDQETTDRIAAQAGTTAAAPTEQQA